MEIIILPNEQEAGVLGARIVADQVRRKPESILGLATGATPLGLYREWIRLHREEGLDCRQLTTFNLDEYVGLGPEHPASYATYMREHLFSGLNIPAHRVHLPDGLSPDIPAFCRQYEGAIAASGGIDLQILGIGGDGHIGFNEPSSSLASRTRIKTLTEETLRDNARYFGPEEEPPRHVITMGVGTIMDSRRILLLAFGAGKARAVAQACEGSISSRVPASALQMHPHVVVLLDEASAGQLERADYYRWVYENKPEWQRI